jgi:hypothetical protein
MDNTNKPNTSIEVYKAGGLSDTEAFLVKEWVDKGRPGISNVKADQLLSIYLLGYNCYEINKEFPEYPLPAVLWCRAKFDWDKRREEYNLAIQDAIAKHAVNVRSDAIRFMGELIAATHIKWRKDILKYLAAPDREKAPACLPGNLNEYGTRVSLLDEIMNPAGKIKNLPGAQAGVPEGTPLVSVNINNSSNEPRPVIVDQDAVKSSLILEMNKDKK